MDEFFVAGPISSTGFVLFFNDFFAYAILVLFHRKVRKRVTYVLARGGQTVTGWLLARSVESLSYLFFRGSRNNRAFFRVFFRGSRERSIVSRDPRNNTLFRVIRERISRTLSSQGPWCSTPFFQSYRGPWKAMMHRVISIDETA